MQVNALNSKGQVVGFSYTSGNLSADAFLFHDGVLTDIGTLGGRYSQAFGVNTAGQVVGEANLAGDDLTHAFLYDGTNMIDLETLGGSFSSAAAINNAGSVVGYSFLPGDASETAFLYANGAMHDLGDLGGGSSSGTAINQAGTVVGNSLTGNSETHAFVSRNGVITDLGTLGGDYSFPFGLNDVGIVVGESAQTNGETHAFMYSGSHMVDLGTLSGTYSRAIAINSAGQAIGLATTTNDNETHGFVYTGGALTDLGTLGGDYSDPAAINNLGQIVGNSDLPSGKSHAFLWQNGTMVDLNTLLPASSGWELQSAEFINDSNRIVGTGIYNGAGAWFVMDLGATDNPPVADAGGDQEVECPTLVKLDGSHSTDPDGDSLTYEWSESGAVFSTQAVVSVSFSVGEHTITLKVSDPSGASSQATVKVRVTDTTPPTVVCPATLLASSGPGCQAPIPNVLAGIVAQDNCTSSGSLTINQSPAAGTLVGLGPHQILVTVSDASGNQSSCMTLFTVADTTAPTVTSLTGPITLSADTNCQAVVPNVLGQVVASDNCTPVDQLTMTQTPTTGTLVGTGQHAVTVTVTDASGNSATARVSLNVVDTTAPTITTVPGPITLSADANCQAAVPNVLGQIVASDNCTPANQLVMSQSPSAGTSVGTGQHTITVTVNDASGNSTAASVSLNVVDTTAPTITSVPGPITLSADATCQAAVPNILGQIVASDNCTPANQLVITQTPSTGTLIGTGQHSITVTVTDSSGNSAAASVSLNVVDTTAPTIQSLNVTPSVLSPPNHQLVPVMVSVIANDACDPAPVSKIVSISCNETSAAGDAVITGNLTANLAASRNPSGSGRIYTLTVQCKDASGNASVAFVIVTVPKGNGK